MKNAKRLLTVLFLFTAGLLSALEIESLLSPELVKKDAVLLKSGKPVPAPEYTVILFFDALAPQTQTILEVADSIPNLVGGNVAVLAVARNTKDVTADALHTFHPENLLLLTENDQKTVFKEYAFGEVIIPFAVVIDKEDTVLWKGAPTDIESTLKRIRNGKYSRQTQMKIEQFRNDLQSGVQSGLPEVILRAADGILALDPADTIAIQAKLYVLQGRNRTDLAKAFLQERVKAVPDDLTLRIVLLNFLIQSGDRAGFRTAFTETAGKNWGFNGTERLLSFVLDNAPFAWLPMKEVQKCAWILAYNSNRVALHCALRARVAYLCGDVDAAIKLQQKAVARQPDNADFADVLAYYQSIKAPPKK